MAVNDQAEDLNLFQAIRANEVDFLKELLEQGVDPNIRNGEDDTALMVAVDHGHTEIVKILLSQNANVNAEGEHSGKTAISSAVCMKNLEITEMLLEAGADCNVQDINEQNVLFYAIDNQDCEMVALLLRLGNCRHDLLNFGGATALHCAANSGYADVIHVMLENGFNPHLVSPDSFAPLMCATRVEAVDVLLQAGASVNAVDENGLDCLHHAVNRDDESVIRRLIDVGADVNRKVHGQPPLLRALCEGKRKAIKVFLEYGVDVMVVDNQNRGTLYYAASHSDPQLCAHLIQLGADPHLVSNDGTTPVYIAVSRHHTNVAKVLIMNGVDLNRRYFYDNKVATLLDIAIGEHLAELSSLLHDLGCPTVERYSESSEFPAAVNEVVAKLRNTHTLQSACRISLFRKYGRDLEKYLDVSAKYVVKVIVRDILMKDRFIIKT